MTHPLDGSREKLRHAREHKDMLYAALADTKTPGNEVVVALGGKHDPNRQAWVVFVQEVPDLPLRWGSIIGDEVSNYRGALDLMVWQLAIMDGGGKRPDGRTAFPICRDDAEFRSKGARALTSIDPSRWAEFERLQPYPPHWKRRAPSPLLVLNALSNDNKHRVLQPVFLVPQELSFTFPTVGSDYRVNGPPKPSDATGRPLKANAELVEIPIEQTGPKPQVEVKPDAAMQVGLRNGLPIDGVLEAIDLKVAGIIETFAPEFEGPAAKALWGQDFGRIHETDPGGWEEATLSVVDPPEFRRSLPPSRG
jgi:hypothetical protein